MGYKLRYQAPLEKEIQKGVVQWLQFNLDKYKNISYVAVVNEYVKKNNMQAAKNAGFRKGFPDLMIFTEGGKTLFIEFKLPNGVVSEEQDAIHKELTKLGHNVSIIRAYNVKDAVAKINDMLEKQGIKITQNVWS